MFYIATELKLYQVYLYTGIFKYMTNYFNRNDIKVYFSWS